MMGRKIRGDVRLDVEKMRQASLSWSHKAPGVANQERECRMDRRTFLLSTASTASVAALGGSFLVGSARAQSAAAKGDKLPVSQTNPYMGAPVTLTKAPNGAIANKKILDGIEKVAWLKPTIEQPAKEIWQFGGYGLAPMIIIDTDEGLIAFDRDHRAQRFIRPCRLP